MSREVDITCPYCNLRQRYLTPNNEGYSQELYYCEVESGGCDKLFVVKSQVTVTVEARCLKIEGES